MIYLHKGVDIEPYQWVRSELPEPDLEIFLGSSPEVCVERIIKRDSYIKRHCEELDELIVLDNIYQSFYQKAWFPLKLVNTDQASVIATIIENVTSDERFKQGKMNDSTEFDQLFPSAVTTCACCGLLQYK
ncbi:MAG: hypothetical protein AAGI25_20650 [Bacteroidota bacterium]